MAVIDTLKLARELRGRGGFTQEAAEATAEALNDALGRDVATKQDLDRLGSDLRAEMARLHAELLKWMFGQTAIIPAILGALHFIR